MAAALPWLLPVATGTAALATIDATKAAKHQGRVQAETQNRQLEQTAMLQQQELDATTRIQEQAIAAQRSAQAASLAQAARAAAESKALMEKQMKAADENINRASQKRPNTARIVDEAAQAGKAGASGTMLTGPQGVDPGTLSLGRSTLLGA